MSNRWWDFFRVKLYRFICSILPEGVKRQVLYELVDRVAEHKHLQKDVETWNVTFEDMYNRLGDYKVKRKRHLK
jgi:hypothetical protein